MTTTAFVQAMMESQTDMRSTDCVILANCQTSVFEFPKTHLLAEHPPQPATIAERPGARATVVSDFSDYFLHHTPFPQFKICCALRSKVGYELSKRAKNSCDGPFPLSLVVELETPCKTTLASGTSYIIDQAALPGVSKGEEVVMAWMVDDAPWPTVDENDNRFVNTVLAAVKITQDQSEVIREAVKSSCFQDDTGRAVYPMSMMFNANLKATSTSSENEFRDKLDELRRLIEALELRRAENRGHIDTLVDALRLEEIETDHYRRAWYLCLFEATKATLKGQAQHDFNQRHRAYRKTIGHPKPNAKMDMHEFEKLQKDALAQLKAAFLQT